MVNTKLTKPRVRGKTRRKTSLYSKLEKASMLIGTAGLLGGVIGPVIAPAEEVLAAIPTRSQAKQGGSGGKAAPLGTSERKPGPSKKTGGKGSGGKGGKAPNKLDSSYPVPWGNALYHENGLGPDAGKLSIKGYLTYKGKMVGKPFGGKPGKLGWTMASNVKSETGKHDKIYLFERGYDKSKTIDETQTPWGNTYAHYAPDSKHGAGKIGMFYTGEKNGAGTYYDIKTHKSIPVDFRLTYMGGNNQQSNVSDLGREHEHWHKKGSKWTLKNGKKIITHASQGDGRYLAFSGQTLGVYDLGRGTDGFRLQIINHKTGQPMAYQGPMTFWDIDESQAIKISNSKAYLHASNKPQGNDIGPTMLKEGRNKESFNGYVIGIKTKQNQNKHPWDRQGTVNNNDSRGAFTAVTDGASGYNLTFDRWGQGKYELKKSSAPSTKPMSSVPATKDKIQKSGNFYGNWFQIGSNTNIAQRKVDKKDANTGKMVSVKPGSFSKWNEKNWSMKLTKPVKAGDKFYYAIQTQVDWGTGVYNAGSGTFSKGKSIVAKLSQVGFKNWQKNKSHYSIIKNLGFEDVLDKRLKLAGDPQVYATQKEDGKTYPLTHDFTIQHPTKNGQIHIVAALKDSSKAAQNGTKFEKSIRNKIIRLVIPVQVEKSKTSFNLTADQAAKVEASHKDPKGAVKVKTVKNADGSTTTTSEIDKSSSSSSSRTENVNDSYKGAGMKKMATIPNVAIITQNDQVLKSKTTWARTVPGDKDNKPKPKPKVTDTQGAKEVFVQEPGTNTWKISDNDNYDGGDVLPAQWLTYQTQFKLPDKGAKMGDITKSDNEINGDPGHDRDTGEVDDNGNPVTVHVTHKAKSKISQITFTDTLDSRLDASTIKKAPKGDKLVKPYVGLGDSTGSLQKLSGNEVHVSGNQLKIVLKGKKAEKYAGGKSLYVRFRVRLKKNKVQSRIPVHNIATLKTQVTQTVAKYETDQDGNTEHVESNSGETDENGDKLNKGSKTAKTNKVTNYLVPANTPENPTKDTSYTGKSGDGDSSVSALNPNDEITYTITQPLGTRGVDIGDVYSNITLSDNIDSHLKIVSVDVQSPIKGQKTVSGNHVEWIANKDEMASKPANGGVITMTIKAKYPAQTMRDATVAADNTEHTSIGVDYNDYPNLDSNTVSVGLPSIPSSDAKTLVGVYDLTTGQTQDPNSILDPRDDYRLTYAITAQVENADNSGFTVTDQMPENTKLDVSSISSTDSKGLSVSTSGSTENELHATVSGGKDVIGSQVQIDYSVKVEHESDWSDYYSDTPVRGTHVPGQMVYNNESDTVDANSYLKIPNTAEITYGSGDHHAVTDYFNMGVQLFDTQQVIIQDDDRNWDTNLEKSHYVDHKRNDKTAVTTAIMVQVPNYLKISTLNVANNFKEPRFERGETHMLRANNALVHDKSLLQNPDFTKADFATASPYIGEQKFDGHEPVDKQKMSGKTYWSFTKWSPETRFFKDYAKLKNMRDSFTGQVNFAGHSAGSRHADFSDSDLHVSGDEQVNYTGSQAAIPNEVGIHLSNIYAYYDMIDRGTFGTGIEDQNDPKLDYNKFDDGKKMDYNLYGEVKGLAVDPTEKTNFDNETGGQPVSAWLKTNGYDAGKKTLQLKNGLGQGETAPVVQTWTGLDADKLTGVDTDHGYYSKSNTYRDTKLDPYLGKNPAIAEEKGHSKIIILLADDIHGR